MGDRANEGDHCEIDDCEGFYIPDDRDGSIEGTLVCCDCGDEVAP